jgi:hypothetical protein
MTIIFKHREEFSYLKNEKKEEEGDEENTPNILEDRGSYHHGK